MHNLFICRFSPIDIPLYAFGRRKRHSASFLNSYRFALKKVVLPDVCSIRQYLGKEKIKMKKEVVRIR